MLNVHNVIMLNVYNVYNVAACHFDKALQTTGSKAPINLSFY